MQSNRSKQKPNPRPQTTFTFEAIGTHWVIELFEDVANPDDLLAVIKQRIDVFDQTYSRFRDDSLVTQMATKPGTYTLPADAEPLFDLYEQLYKISKGKVTPLIGNLLEDTGYDANYSLSPRQTIRSLPSWEDALEYAYPTLHVRQPVVIDLGAAGKGYLVDIISGLLSDAGVRNFCVNAGGDMYVSDPPEGALAVALEHPDNLTQAIGIAKLTEGSICGSSGNRRAWRGYMHILDPQQKQSPQHIKAVWVCAQSALIADALSTCLFFMEPDVLTEYFEYDYAIVNSDNSLVYSRNFPAEFFN
jgi:thiamine biosynthesis lipoprotein